MSMTGISILSSANNNYLRANTLLIIILYCRIVLFIAESALRTVAFQSEGPYLSLVMFQYGNYLQHETTIPLLMARSHGSPDYSY
jgi:hypothetical protein